MGFDRRSTQTGFSGDRSPTLKRFFRLASLVFGYLVLVPMLWMLTKVSDVLDRRTDDRPY